MNFAPLVMISTERPRTLLFWSCVIIVRCIMWLGQKGTVDYNPLRTLSVHCCPVHLAEMIARSTQPFAEVASVAGSTRSSARLLCYWTNLGNVIMNYESALWEWWLVCFH